MKSFDQQYIDQFIKDALKEDIGDGDHTSLSTIPPGSKGNAKLICKESGIIAGIEIARLVFKALDPKCKIKTFKKDGEKVYKGDIILSINGSAQKILQAERLALNIMQRMSGIATQTHHMLSLCKGTKVKLLDTRKTTPLFRYFEKLAVKIGGGTNHRFGLYDMILIKDNHIDYCGGVTEAIKAAKEYIKKRKKRIKIEVETRNLEEVKEVLGCKGIHRILLDNFDPSDLKKAVKLIDGKCETEASGNITVENINVYAKTGVTYISSGALTHSVKCLDFSLKASIDE